MKCGSRIFIVYLDFNAPDSTLLKKTPYYHAGAIMSSIISRTMYQYTIICLLSKKGTSKLLRHGTG